MRQRGVGHSAAEEAAGEEDLLLLPERAHHEGTEYRVLRKRRSMRIDSSVADSVTCVPVTKRTLFGRANRFRCFASSLGTGSLFVGRFVFFFGLANEFFIYRNQKRNQIFLIV